MENSASSKVFTQEQATSFQEDSSSWTSYTDDLLTFDTSYSSSSHHHFSSYYYDCFHSPQYCSSASHSGADSSFTSSHQSKRRKTTAAADHDLEDTATSPPHPAAIISKMDRLSSKQKKKQRPEMNTQAKQKGKVSECGEVEDKIEVGFVERDKNCSSGLKHIGLCLVPVSVAVNYFG